MKLLPSTPVLCAGLSVAVWASCAGGGAEADTHATGQIGANHGSALSLTPLSQGGLGLGTVGWVPGSSQVARYGGPGGHGMDDLFIGYGILWLPEWKTDSAKELDYWRGPLASGGSQRHFYQGSFEWVEEILIPQLRSGNAMDRAAANRIADALNRGRQEGEASKYIRYLNIKTLTTEYSGKAEVQGTVRIAKLQPGRVTHYERVMGWAVRNGRAQILPSGKCYATPPPGAYTVNLGARNPSPAARAAVTAGQAADAARVVTELIAPFVKAARADAMAQQAYQQLGFGVAQAQHEIPKGRTGWVRITLSGPEECVDDSQGYTVRVGFTPATGNVHFLGSSPCQPGARQEVYPLRTGRVGRESWETVPAPESTLSPPGWTSIAYNLCVAGVGAPPQTREQPPPPQGPRVYVYVLDGIGVVISTPDVVTKTPACQWTGGGPRPCPGAPPAKVVGSLGDPAGYASEKDAKAALKTQLACFNGYWGAFINFGSGKAWLQNNVTTSDCLTVKQL